VPVKASTANQRKITPSTLGPACTPRRYQRAAVSTWRDSRRPEQCEGVALSLPDLEGGIVANELFEIGDRNRFFTIEDQQILGEHLLTDALVKHGRDEGNYRLGVLSRLGDRFFRGSRIVVDLDFDQRQPMSLSNRDSVIHRLVEDKGITSPLRKVGLLDERGAWAKPQRRPCDRQFLGQPVYLHAAKHCSIETPVALGQQLGRRHVVDLTLETLVEHLRVVGSKSAIRRGSAKGKLGHRPGIYVIVTTGTALTRSHSGTM